MRRAAFAVVAAILAGCGGGADQPVRQAGFDPELAVRLQRALDEGRRTYGVTGASAAVVVRGRGLWTGASGRVSRGGAPVTPQTPFNIGSVTKTFVAALVLDLAADGLLRLDDPLARWVPSYPGARRLTVRQLLNHTSGIADYVDNPAFREAALADAPELRTIEGVLGFVPPPPFEPGESWSYSNAGYLLLARVVEAATGSTFGRELERRLLAPLRVAGVVYPPEQPVPEDVAHAYLDIDGDGDTEDVFPRAHIQPGRPTVAFGWTDGGVVATPSTVARWAHALFGGRVLGHRWLDEMLEFVESGTTDYGLGVERKRESGRISWGHAGINIGYHTELRHYPDAGVTIAVAWNDERLHSDLLLQELVRVVLG